MSSNILTNEYNSVIPLNNFIGTTTEKHGLTLLDITGNKLHNRMSKCQKKHIVLECMCGELKKIPLNCQIRICPTCESVRKYKLDKRIFRYFQLFQYPKLLTLTLSQHRVPDKEMKGKIERYCRQFRRTLSDLPHDLRLKYRVIGKGYKLSGFRFLECEPKEDGFHIHFHYILNQKYFIPQKLISEVWLKVTSDSFIVDIRPITKRKGLEYALKYASKPMDIFKFKKFGLTEKQIIKIYVELFYKRRMFSKIGIFYNINLKFELRRFKCSECGSTDWIIHFNYENPVIPEFQTDWGGKNWN